MRILTGLLALLAILCLNIAARAELRCRVDREMVKPGEAVYVTLSGLQPGDLAVKIYAADGRCVRTLFHKYNTAERLMLRWNLKDADDKPVPPGAYRFSARNGMRLALDTAFGKEGFLTRDDLKTPITVKTDRAGNLYVLDRMTSAVHKFRADGSPANDFAGKNVLNTPYNTKGPFWGGLALDDDGRLYLPVTYGTAHWIDMIDGTGTPQYYIGGFFGKDPDWETEEKGGFAYPGWAAVGMGPRLYATSPGYGMLAAWDATKAKKDGALWIAGRKPDSRENWIGNPGLAGDTDGKRAIYLNAAPGGLKHGMLMKYLDADDKVIFAYTLKAYTVPGAARETPLEYIYGVTCDREGGIYCVLRKAGTIVKLSDNGTGFDFVTQFGDPSLKTLRAIALGPDGRALYLLEDGESTITEDLDKAETDRTPDAPTGPGRVSKYRITYVGEAEQTVTVQP